MSGFEHLPHYFEEIVLHRRGKRDGNQRTYRVDMVITDQDAQFISTVLSRFIGQIIGYRIIDSSNPERQFVRLLSVDSANKEISVCPVSFHPCETERHPLLTEHRGRIHNISMLDIADVVSFRSGARAEIIVEE